jgi:N-acetylmuramoyl-L-alanine amidase
MMEVGLPEDTRQVVVRLFLANDDEPFATHRLAVGHLDPIETVLGIQARLMNLGYYAGAIDGQLDDVTKSAISAFRSAVLGNESSEIDDVLLEALAGKHGS